MILALQSGSASVDACSGGARPPRDAPARGVPAPDRLPRRARRGSRRRRRLPRRRDAVATAGRTRGAASCRRSGIGRGSPRPRRRGGGANRPGFSGGGLDDTDRGSGGWRTGARPGPGGSWRLSRASSKGDSRCAAGRPAARRPHHARTGLTHSSPAWKPAPRSSKRGSCSCRLWARAGRATSMLQRLSVQPSPWSTCFRPGRRCCRYRCLAATTPMPMSACSRMSPRRTAHSTCWAGHRRMNTPSRRPIRPRSSGSCAARGVPPLHQVRALQSFSPGCPAQESRPSPARCTKRCWSAPTGRSACSTATSCAECSRPSSASPASIES